jgi:hypothetical protein
MTHLRPDAPFLATFGTLEFNEGIREVSRFLEVLKSGSSITTSPSSLPLTCISNTLTLDLPDPPTVYGEPLSDDCPEVHKDGAMPLVVNPSLLRIAALMHVRDTLKLPTVSSRKGRPKGSKKPYHIFTPNKVRRPSQLRLVLPQYSKDEDVTLPMDLASPASSAHSLSFTFTEPATGSPTAPETLTISAPLSFR